MTEIDTRPKGTPGRKPNPATPILEAIKDELKRQDERWGEQNHPLLGGLATSKDNYRAYLATQEANWKRFNDVRVNDEALGWDGIILEEVFEALAEPDPAKAEVELIQAAACCVQALISLRRQAAR